MKEKWKMLLPLTLASVFISVVTVYGQPSGDVSTKEWEFQKQERELKNEQRELQKQRRALEMERKKHRKEEMRERIELMIMWKLTEELDLDQETANRVFPLLHEHNKQQRERRTKRARITERMQEELGKDSPEPDTLRQLIDEFKQNERDLAEERIKRLDDFSEVLSEEQVAKLIMMVPKIENRVRDAIQKGRMMRAKYGDSRKNPGAPLPTPHTEPMPAPPGSD
jgi:hypothetical protein